MGALVDAIKRILRVEPGAGLGYAYRKAGHWLLRPRSERAAIVGGRQPQEGEKRAWLRHDADDIVVPMGGMRAQPLVRASPPGRQRTWKGSWAYIAHNLRPNRYVYGTGSPNCYEAAHYGHTIHHKSGQITGPSHPIGLYPWDQRPDREDLCHDYGATELRHYHQQDEQMLGLWDSDLWWTFPSLVLEGVPPRQYDPYPHLSTANPRSNTGPAQYETAYCPLGAWFMRTGLWAHLPYACAQCWRFPDFEADYDEDDDLWKPRWTGGGWANPNDVFTTVMAMRTQATGPSGGLSIIASPWSKGFGHWGATAYWPNFAGGRYTPGTSGVWLDDDGYPWLLAVITNDGQNIPLFPMYGNFLPPGTYYYACAPVSHVPPGRNYGYEMGLGPVEQITLSDDPVAGPGISDIYYGNETGSWSEGTYEFRASYFRPGSSPGQEETAASGVLQFSHDGSEDSVLVKVGKPGVLNGAINIYCRKISPTTTPWHIIQGWGDARYYNWWLTNDAEIECDEPPGETGGTTPPSQGTLHARGVLLWGGWNPQRRWKLGPPGTEWLRIYRAGPYDGPAEGFIPPGHDFRMVYEIDIQAHLRDAERWPMGLEFFEPYDGIYYPDTLHSWVRPWYWYVRILDLGLAPGQLPPGYSNPTTDPRSAILVARSNSNSAISPAGWTDVTGWMVTPTPLRQAILQPVDEETAILLYIDGGLQARNCALEVAPENQPGPVKLAPAVALGSVVPLRDEEGEQVTGEWLISWAEGTGDPENPIRWMSGHLHPGPALADQAEAGSGDYDTAHTGPRLTNVRELDPISIVMAGAGSSREALSLYDGCGVEPEWGPDEFRVPASGEPDMPEMTTLQAPPDTSESGHGFAWQLAEVDDPDHAEKCAIICARWESDDVSE